MKPLMREYWRRAVHARGGSRVRGVLWPASFPDAPRARVTAHALAALVLVTAVCGAYTAFYWADDPQVDRRSRVAVLLAGGSTMAIPVLLMGLVLFQTLRDRLGALYGLLTALAWLTALAGTPLLVLETAVMNDSDYCTAYLPRHPLPGSVLPTSLLVALAAGSATAWIMSTLSPRRSTPVTRYAVWLGTVAVTVVLTLAPQLHSAQTCGSETGAAELPSGVSGDHP